MGKKRKKQVISSDSESDVDESTSSYSSEPSKERHVEKRKSNKKKKVKRHRSPRSSTSESSQSDSECYVEKKKKKKSKKHKKRFRSSVSCESSSSSSSEEDTKSKQKSSKKKRGKEKRTKKESQNTRPDSASVHVKLSESQVHAEVKVYNPAKQTYTTHNVIVKLHLEKDLEEFKEYLNSNYLDALAQNNSLIGKYKSVITMIANEKSYEVLGEESWATYKSVLQEGGELKIKVKPIMTAEVKKILETDSKKRGKYKKSEKVEADEKLSETLEEIMKTDADIKGNMPEINRTPAQSDLLKQFENGKNNFLYNFWYPLSL